MTLEQVLILSSFSKLCPLLTLYEGLTQARLTVTVFGESSAEVKAVAGVVREVLDGHRGVLGSVILNKVEDCYDDKVEVWCSACQLTIRYEE